MNDLISIIEKKINISVPKTKIPYSFGIIVGYFFDFINLFLNKKTIISSVRIKKFCATTQFCSKEVRKVFEPPYSLYEGLNNTLENEFIKEKDDDIIFFTE